MTPNELNAFLNTPKAAHSMPLGSSEIPKKNSGNILIFFVLGITLVAVSFYLLQYKENSKLKQKIK
jgi:hypothetical protein